MFLIYYIYFIFSIPDILQFNQFNNSINLKTPKKHTKGEKNCLPTVFSLLFTYLHFYILLYCYSMPDPLEQ